MFNYRIFIVVILFILGAALAGFLRLHIDTDLVRSLPSGETVIQDGLEIFARHPIHDQMAMDIQLNQENPDLLVQCADLASQKLSDSTLFTDVGTQETSDLIPDIAIHVVNSLPLLFTKEELEQNIAPRLDETFIDQHLQQQLVRLGSLQGIGQARFITMDPLGFMEPIMAKMAKLKPFQNSRMYKKYLLSSDNRHLLLVARPSMAGTDTAAARDISALLLEISQALNEQFAGTDTKVTLTAVGAYQAALDNETIIRHDVNLALFLSVLGIALLLLTAFSRPFLGLLSFLPAVAGSAVALFTFSLFHDSISIMVLGFGGAVISITVDHGIAYLLFLDRPQATKGQDASHEVRAVGILAVLTTCGAFLLLGFSNFPIFIQLGQFTALGVMFSFLFVHFIFPHITPRMPAATRDKLPLQGLVDAFYATGRLGASAAALLACLMIFWMRPDFNVSLETMNTVSQETQAADKLFSDVWGDISRKVFLMNSAEDIARLQNENDVLLQQIRRDQKTDLIASAFVPSMIFPGRLQSEENLTAWKTFWSPQRIEALKHNLQTAAAQMGFAETAFADFIALLQPSYEAQSSLLPARLYPLMGISENNGQLFQFITVTPGSRYDSRKFSDSYGQRWKIFDSPFFSEQLAAILFKTFATMFGLIAVSAVLLLFFFFLSWQLTLITLLPPVFAYICTLGTMKLIGHAIDIPGLMLSIVILGMGIDYSIFFVRAQQRYRQPEHPAFKRIRMAVFMAGTSTLIGFGVLCFAEHSLLRSIGITSLLGIGYSLIGAFLLLPPLLHYLFDREKNPAAADTLPLNKRVLNRYKLMEAYPRMFARFKLKSDPLFADLARLLSREPCTVKTILDIGCGYGVPGCWALEHFPHSTITGIDPDPERVRVAALATGKRGTIIQAMAPELPVAKGSTDLILILDMLHYLDNETASKLFSNCFQALKPGAMLVVRFVIRPEIKASRSWQLEDYRVKISGNRAHYRSSKQMADILQDCGFRIATNRVSQANSELFWITARAY